MNKKILKAFAKEIRARNYNIKCSGEEIPFFINRDIELISKIASQFNPRFDKKRFIEACLKED